MQAGESSSDSKTLEPLSAANNVGESGLTDERLGVEAGVLDPSGSQVLQALSRVPRGIPFEVSNAPGRPRRRT